jgi:hypothetical protein
MRYRTRVNLAYYLIELIRNWVVPDGCALKFHLKKPVLDFYQKEVVKITKELNLKSIGV